MTTIRELEEQLEDVREGIALTSSFLYTGTQAERKAHLQEITVLQNRIPIIENELKALRDATSGK